MPFSTPDSDLHTFQTPDEDTTSTLGAAGRGALDALPFGDKAAAAVQGAVNGGSASDYLQQLDNLLATDKAIHPIAHGAGEVAGTIAPFAIPGVGEALGADSLAGRAAIGAGIGGLQGASSNRNPNSMMSDILKGAGVGAVANPVVGAAGDVLGDIGSKIAGSKLGDRASATMFTQANGLNPMALRKIAILEGNSPENAVNELADKLQAIVPNGYYSPTSSINDKLGILQGLKDNAGSVIGKARQAAGQMADFPEGQQTIDDLAKQATDWNDVANPEGADNIKNAAALLQAAKDKGALTFDNMYAIKSKVGEGYKNPMNVKPGTDEIYSTLSKNLDSALDRLGPAGGVDPNAFKQAKDTYALTSKLMPLMTRGAGREVGSALSPMKGALGLGSLSLGHPMGAVATGLKAAQELGAPELPANVGMMAKNALSSGISVPSVPGGPAAASITSLLAHPAMSPFRATFQQATQGLTQPSDIEKALVVTDFLQSQSNPSYAAAKQKATEANQ